MSDCRYHRAPYTYFEIEQYRKHSALACDLVLLLRGLSARDALGALDQARDIVLAAAHISPELKFATKPELPGDPA